MIGMICALVVDNHKFFRWVAVTFLAVQIFSETISAFDIAKELRTLDSKCTALDDVGAVDAMNAGARNVDADDLENSCASHREGQWWGKSDLTMMLHRDIAASAFELLSLLLVAFIGISLGFVRSKYSYTQINSKHNNDVSLWNELGKLGITPSNFHQRVKMNSLSRR